ncbi:MAG: DUF948 domain-containing protein [Nitrospiraceae bacterium]|nr:DUF948 domain-containing protein [Nitrospiraceae bacterium]
MVEPAALLVAVAFTVLVAYLVSTLIQIRKTAVESERLFSQLNDELPSLFTEIRRLAENLNAAAIEARDGIEHASVLLHAMGEMGETVQQVHSVVRGQGGHVLGRLTSVIAGVKAASSAVKQRISQTRRDIGRR